MKDELLPQVEDFKLDCSTNHSLDLFTTPENGMIFSAINNRDNILVNEDSIHKIFNDDPDNEIDNREESLDPPSSVLVENIFSETTDFGNLAKLHNKSFYDMVSPPMSPIECPAYNFQTNYEESNWGSESSNDSHESNADSRVYSSNSKRDDDTFSPDIMGLEEILTEALEDAKQYDITTKDHSKRMESSSSYSLTPSESSDSLFMSDISSPDEAIDELFEMVTQQSRKDSSKQDSPGKPLKNYVVIFLTNKYPLRSGILTTQCTVRNRPRFSI